MEDQDQEMKIRNFVDTMKEKFPDFENGENIITFKVSNKETLSITLNRVDTTCDYNFALHMINNGKVQVNLNGSFYNMFFKEDFERDITNTAFMKELDELKFVEKNVNYTLMLFGLPKEEKYVRGKLEKWDRIDGKIIMNGNLAKLTKRRKKYNREHHKNEIRNYSLKECQKAECTHFITNTCEFGINLTNNKDVIKLKNGIGYCYDYFNKRMIQKERELTKELLEGLVFEQITFSNTLRIKKRDLSKIAPEEFDHNIISAFFSRKKFTKFMKLCNKNLPKRKEHVLNSLDTAYQGLRYEYNELMALGDDLKERIIHDKTHIKARKDYDISHVNINETINYTVEEANKLIKNINDFNFLLTNLFQGKRENTNSLASDLKETSIIYFPFSKEREVRNWKGNKSKDYDNVGRIKIEDEWINKNLSPIGDYYYSEYKTRYPLYKIISKKKSFTEISPLFSKSVIRLLHTKPNRHYYPKNLIIPKIRPKIQKIKMVVKQSCIEGFI